MLFCLPYKLFAHSLEVRGTQIENSCSRLCLGMGKVKESIFMIFCLKIVICST